MMHVCSHLHGGSASVYDVGIRISVCEFPKEGYWSSFASDPVFTFELKVASLIISSSKVDLDTGGIGKTAARILMFLAISKCA